MRNYVTQTLSLILGLSKIGFPNIYSQVSIGVTSFPIPDAAMVIRSHKMGTYLTATVLNEMDQ